MSNALIALLQNPPPGASALTILETDRQSPGEFILDGLRSIAGDLIETVLAGGSDSSGDAPTLYFHVGWFVSPQHPFNKVVIRQRGPETLLAILPPACAAARDRRLPVDFIAKDQPPCRLDPWLPPAAPGAAEQLAKERWNVVRKDALFVSHASRENAPLWLRVFVLPLILGVAFWFWWVAVIMFLLSRKTALEIWGQIRFLAVGANVRWNLSVDAASLTATREDESLEQFAAPLHDVLHIVAIGKPRALWLISPRHAVIWRPPNACAARAEVECTSLAELLRGEVIASLKRQMQG